MRLTLVTLLALLLLAAPAGATIVPGKGMAGITLGECQEQVIKELGFPDRTFGTHDFAGFVSKYTYVKPGLKLEFRQGPGRCLTMTSIRTTKGAERTQEGVGKGTLRRTLRAKLHGEKCHTYTKPKRISICSLGSYTPSKPVTEFRIDSKGRVNNIRVGIVID